MSREWYIRTDQRHIQDTFGDIDTTRPTFKEKLRQNYKKYILWAVEIAVLVTLIIVAFPIMFPKNTADYTITLATEAPVSDEAIAALKDELKAAGVDRNGDGEVQIEVRALSISSSEEGLRNPALEQLITTFRTDEYSLLAMQPTIYERYVQAYTAKGQSLFDPFEGANSQNLWEQQKGEHLPRLVWGIRTIPGDGGAKDTQKAHLALLQTYIQKQVK